MKTVVKILAWLLGSLLVIFLLLIVYVRSVAVISEPEVAEADGEIPQATTSDGTLTRINSSWLRMSESGLYEMYLEGKPYERGVIAGRLSRDLLQYQEKVFNEQIHQLVPSTAWLNVLKYFVGWFNRDLDDNVPEEFRQEILGVSRAASHDFDDIASPYQRILNYHAAHDIGHALQNMALVGCTGFATWNESSEDSTLIIGRNFDFYVGDAFAENKIVAFYKPENGHPFMMITFGGMTGVLSGMNDKGLTVTLNAAKSEIPGASATPVSIVAREILQYASTIEEAYAIASKRKTFVSESFLIGSGSQRRAAIIEKSPEEIDLYTPEGSRLIATNHFQSKKLGQQALNLAHMKTSASPYRFARVKELLERDTINSVVKTAAILRNRGGLGDKSIGLGNEKSVNQLIAHHAVIFQPEKKLVWVSTAPWQLGKFVCYDLAKVFQGADLKQDVEIYEQAMVIPPDSFLTSPEFQHAIRFNRFRFPFQLRHNMVPDSMVSWNPESYLSYMLAGDHYFGKKEYGKAATMYRTGLTKEVATEHERSHMEEQLRKCE